MRMHWKALFIFIPCVSNEEELMNEIEGKGERKA